MTPTRATDVFRPEALAGAGLPPDDGPPVPTTPEWLRAGFWFVVALAVVATVGAFFVRVNGDRLLQVLLRPFTTTLTAGGDE